MGFAVGVAQPFTNAQDTRNHGITALGLTRCSSKRHAVHLALEQGFAMCACCAVEQRSRGRAALRLFARCTWVLQATRRSSSVRTGAWHVPRIICVACLTSAKDISVRVALKPRVNPSRSPSPMRKMHVRATDATPDAGH